MVSFMKCLFLIIGLVWSFAFLSSSQAVEGGDQAAIQSCLSHWGKHPFPKKNPEFKVISAKVKVLGIGGEMKDDIASDDPALVLVKPSVTVLSKSDLKLLNPNGWYCLKGQVSVLGKSEIKLHCKAHLASSSDGATVLGGNDTDQGVAVLGTIRVTKVDCK